MYVIIYLQTSADIENIFNPSKNNEVVRFKAKIPQCAGKTHPLWYFVYSITCIFNLFVGVYCGQMNSKT